MPPTTEAGLFRALVNLPGAPICPPLVPNGRRTRWKCLPEQPLYLIHLAGLRSGRAENRNACLLAICREKCPLRYPGKPEQNEY